MVRQQASAGNSRLPRLCQRRPISQPRRRPPRYLTVYELSGPEALESEEFRRRRGWEIYASHVQPRVTLYQRLTKRSKQ